MVPQDTRMTVVVQRFPQNMNKMRALPLHGMQKTTQKYKTVSTTTIEKGMSR